MGSLSGSALLAQEQADLKDLLNGGVPMQRAELSAFIMSRKQFDGLSFTSEEISGLFCHEATMLAGKHLLSHGVSAGDKPELVLKAAQNAGLLKRVVSCMVRNGEVIVRRGGRLPIRAERVWLNYLSEEDLISNYFETNPDPDRAYMVGRLAGVPEYSSKVSQWMCEDLDWRHAQKREHAVEDWIEDYRMALLAAANTPGNKLIDLALTRGLTHKIAVQHGVMLMQAACKAGNTLLLDCLMGAGWPVDREAFEYKHNLVIAAENDQQNMFMALLRAGADQGARRMDDCEMEDVPESYQAILKAYRQQQRLQKKISSLQGKKGQPSNTSSSEGPEL